MKLRPAILLLTLLAASAMAEESTCGKTTHGIPMHDRLKTVDIRDAGALFKTFGPAQLTTRSEGKQYTIWYDILHEESGTPTNGSRHDCGVLVALIADGTTTKSVLRSLKDSDIDLLLAGKVKGLGL